LSVTQISEKVTIYDLIAFEHDFGGANWGWIIGLGLSYVQVETRGGSILLIPNEAFVTQ
jgi:hypothetical protein